MELAYSPGGNGSVMRILQWIGEQAAVLTPWQTRGPVEISRKWELNTKVEPMTAFVNRKYQHPVVMLGVDVEPKHLVFQGVDVIIRAQMFCAQLTRPVKLDGIVASLRTAQEGWLPMKQLLVEPVTNGVRVSATADLDVLVGNAGVYLRIDPADDAIYWTGEAWFRWNWSAAWEVLELEQQVELPLCRTFPIINRMTYNRCSEGSSQGSTNWTYDLGGWRVAAVNEVLDDAEDDFYSVVEDSPPFYIPSYPEIGD